MLHDISLNFKNVLSTIVISFALRHRTKAAVAIDRRLDLYVGPQKISVVI